MSGTIGDYALRLDDSLRVAQVLMYTAPDGVRYIAPIGTPHPDPDRALGPMWTRMELVPNGGGGPR